MQVYPPTFRIVSGRFSRTSIGGLTHQTLAANSQIEQELHATASQISLSLSLFLLVQGNFPLVWSAASEIKGRKVRDVLVQRSQGMH